MAWVWSVPVGGVMGGPDELMRLLVPQYIHNHGTLPTGYDSEAIYGTYYWSYAFYPQFLGPIISALFMGIVGLVHNTPHALDLAARLTSVLFAVGTVAVVGLITRKLFEKNSYKEIYMYAAMILVAAWPQFAFLAGYVNNDIIALFGVSVIIYACLLGLKDNWNYKNSLLLAVGFIVCILGYVNSYGFVLFGGLFFIASLVMQNQAVKKIWIMIGVVAITTLVVAGPFFIRNAVIYNGDFLGMRTFKERSIEGERDNGGNSQQTYAEVVKRSSATIFVDKQYITNQSESFIARFGAMNIRPSNSQILIYEIFIIVGGLGLLWMLFAYRKKILTQANRQKLFYGIFILLGSITTIGLSIYYTLAIDYQPQGRYIIYLLAPLIVFGFYGLIFAFNKIFVKRYQIAALSIFILLYGFNSLFLFKQYIMPLN
ncbi:MAG: hypothetical protein V4611_02015 [Patescibacteria group bacterium]